MGWPESWLTERGYRVDGDRAINPHHAQRQPAVGSKPTVSPAARPLVAEPPLATTPAPAPQVHTGGSVAALDLATHCGWAIGPAEAVRSGVVDFGHALDGMVVEARHGELFQRAHRWILSLLAMHRPALLVVEDSGSGLKGDATRVIVGLRAVALMACRTHGVACATVPASQWKAWANGLGWSKDQKTDENDARWLLRYWLATGGKPLTAGKAERRAAASRQGKLLMAQQSLLSKAKPSNNRKRPGTGHAEASSKG